MFEFEFDQWKNNPWKWKKENSIRGGRASLYTGEFALERTLTIDSVKIPERRCDELIECHQMHFWRVLQKTASFTWNVIRTWKQVKTTTDLRHLSIAKVEKWFTDAVRTMVLLDGIFVEGWRYSANVKIITVDAYRSEVCGMPSSEELTS